MTQKTIVRNVSDKISDDIGGTLTSWWSLLQVNKKIIIITSWQHKNHYIWGDSEDYYFIACTSYEIRMYSYLFILTQCRNCNKDKWQKKYEGDVRVGKLEIIHFQKAKICSDHGHEGGTPGGFVTPSSRKAIEVYRK